MASCINAGNGDYPVVGTDNVDVAVLENHHEALMRWAKMGVRDAVLVNIDTHDDIRKVPDYKVEKLLPIVRDKDWPGLSNSLFIGDHSLYDVGDFIYAAARAGIVREVYWIVPYGHFNSNNPVMRLGILMNTYGFSYEDINTFRMSGGCYSGLTNGIRLHLCGPQGLPDINEPVLLSIDLDFFPLYSFEHGTDMLRGVRSFLDTLFRKQYRVVDTVMAYSVTGGYTRVFQRWAGDLLVELIGNPKALYANAPQRYRDCQDAEAHLRAGRFKLMEEYFPHVLAKSGEDAAILSYMGMMYAIQGNVEKTYQYAERACMSDKGYCSIMRRVAVYFFEAGDITTADRLVRRAYELAPGDINYSEVVATSYMKAGRYREAIDHFMMYQRRFGSFPAGFTIGGEAFLALGDKESAMVWFERGLRRFFEDPYASIETPEVAVAMKKAMEFFRANGRADMAEALEKSARFKKATHTPNGGG